MLQQLLDDFHVALSTLVFVRITVFPVFIATVPFVWHHIIRSLIGCRHMLFSPLVRVLSFRWDWIFPLLRANDEFLWCKV